MTQSRSGLQDAHPILPRTPHKPPCNLLGQLVESTKDQVKLLHSLSVQQILWSMTLNSCKCKKPACRCPSPTPYNSLNSNNQIIITTRCSKINSCSLSPYLCAQITLHCLHINLITAHQRWRWIKQALWLLTSRTTTMVLQVFTQTAIITRCRQCSLLTNLWTLISRIHSKSRHAYENRLNHPHLRNDIDHDEFG